MELILLFLIGYATAFPRLLRSHYDLDYTVPKDEPKLVYVPEQDDSDEMFSPGWMNYNRRVPDFTSDSIEEPDSFFRFDNQPPELHPEFFVKEHRVVDKLPGRFGFSWPSMVFNFEKHIWDELVLLRRLLNETRFGREWISKDVLNPNSSTNFNQFLFNEFGGPSFPDIPGAGIPAWKDLPPNYHNSTYDVHVIDGHKVEVNKTITKETADDGYKFFSFEVVHLRPNEETPDLTTPQEQTDLPLTEGSHSRTGSDVDEVFDVEKAEGVPPVEVSEWEHDVETPERVPPVEVSEWEHEWSIPEFDHKDGRQDWPSHPTGSEDFYHEKEQREPMSKRNQLGPLTFLSDDPAHSRSPIPSKRTIGIPPGPVSSSYRYYSGDNVGVDISSDIDVNRRVGSDKQGMVVIHPDSEVFDLPSVLESIKPKEEERNEVDK